MLRRYRNVFIKPRAETKLAWAMPRQGKGRMKSNVFIKPRAETKLAWAMPRQGKGRMNSKIKVDSRFTAAEDRGQYSVCSISAAKLMSFISFYLLLSPSNYKASEACES